MRPRRPRSPHSGPRVGPARRTGPVPSSRRSPLVLVAVIGVVVAVGAIVLVDLQQSARESAPSADIAAPPDPRLRAGRLIETGAPAAASRASTPRPQRRSGDAGVRPGASAEALTVAERSTTPAGASSSDAVRDGRVAGPRVEPPADDAPLESFVDDLLVDLDEELASDDIDEGAPARDGSARARAASRRPAAPRPDDAPFVWTLPGGGYGGYADALASVAEDGAAAGGVEMHVQAIPRALDYHLARATQELERAGFEGEELRQRLVKVHRRHRRDDDLTLFRVRLTPAGGGVHHFLQNKLTRHFEVSLEGRTKSFALVSVDAKPVFEHWAVFEYPPNQPRRYRPRVPLGKIGRMEIVIGVRLDAESSVPVDIRFAGLVRSEQTRDPANSINLPKRQISCVEWDQCVVPTLSVRFFPGRWDEPSPPEGFRELVGELGR